MPAISGQKNKQPQDQSYGKQILFYETYKIPYFQSPEKENRYTQTVWWNMSEMVTWLCYIKWAFTSKSMKYKLDEI